jgi:hypothetical protein
MRTAKLSALAAATKAATTLKGQACAGRPAALVLLAVALITCAVPKTTLGNLFVRSGNTIAEYTNSGAPVNPTLITGLSFPSDIAVSDGFLYVVNFDGTIGKYTTSGATINAH